MRHHFRRAHIWIAINLIGMAAYLRLGSDLWTIPGDEGLPGGPGDAMYWCIVVAPVLLAYAVFNLISLSAIVDRVLLTGRLKSLYIWLAIVAFWVLTFRYDNLRSFRIICSQAGC